jgi:predicted ATPase
VDIRGREAERDVTRTLLRHAERGTGGVVLVDGDPGTGKSLLLRDCADEAAKRGFSLAVGAASRLEQTLPFSTLSAAMPGLFTARDEDDTSRDVADATARWTARVRRFLERQAAAGPVLVCLDDLQWACAETLTVVQALSRDLRRDRVAWLLARSGTPAGGAVHTFRVLEAEGAVRVVLDPLNAEAVTELLADAFGAPPDEGLAELARSAAGNPSLVAEMVSGLREGGAVRVAGTPGTARTVCDGRLPGLAGGAGPEYAAAGMDFLRTARREHAEIVDVAGHPGLAGGRRDRGHPLRHALVEARHPMAGRICRHSAQPGRTR